MHGCSGGGACVVALGRACVVTPGGHAWLLQVGACVVAPGRHAWLLWGEGAYVVAWGACMVAQGVCVVAPGGGACVRYDEIRRYDQ